MLSDYRYRSANRRARQTVLCSQNLKSTLCCSQVMVLKSVLTRTLDLAVALRGRPQHCTLYEGQTLVKLASLGLSLIAACSDVQAVSASSTSFFGP